MGNIHNNLFNNLSWAKIPAVKSLLCLWAKVIPSALTSHLFSAYGEILCN